MKGTRRRAREDALQILYQLDLNNTLTPIAGLHHFETCFTQGTERVDEFTQGLVLGVAEKLKEIDEAIASVSENWRPDRMPVVDRNILRLGVYELEFRDDIPATVSINEMIELAKHFGSESTAAFVNGVLDKIRLSRPQPNKMP